MSDQPTQEPPDGLEAVFDEASTISMPALSVTVDFNQLLFDTNEARAFELIGKLKDLLS